MDYNNLLLDYNNLLSDYNLIIIYYNIASRAAQSNSVYVSVLKIPMVHADSVSNSVSNIVVRFSRRF